MIPAVYGDDGDGGDGDGGDDVDCNWSGNRSDGNCDSDATAGGVAVPLSSSVF